MKLNVDVNEVTLSNVGTTGEFRIRNSAKAFSILSSGLYSNKIRAIIRELSCNAIDSHVAAGRADLPFEVHLPTMLEPWFSVKDFGTGLSGDQVTNIYTTYFESTKTSSNEFIGALGLGSKSPFSYTENFTVTAIKDGVRRIYSAFINESGIPCVAEMSVEDTDEPNGVEVKFSVTDRSDYGSFRHEAHEVFKWFKSQPIITGVSGFEIKPVPYIDKDIVPGVHRYDSSSYYNETSYALMGNIAYPLSKIPEPEKKFGKLAELLRCGLVIEFDIGELDFAASREELSYVPMTIESIRRKLELLNDNLVSYIEDQVKDISNNWEKAAFLTKKTSTRLYRSAVPAYVKKSNFPLYDTANQVGYFAFKITEDQLIKRGLKVKCFYRSSGITKNCSIDNDYIIDPATGERVKVVTIAVEENAIFVFNDLKTGCQNRIKHHFKTENFYGKIYFIESDLPPDERIVHHQWFMKEIHNPPRTLPASSLKKPPTAPRSVTQGIVELKKKTTVIRWNAGARYSWEPLDGKIDDTKDYYYVYLKGVKCYLDSALTKEIQVQSYRSMLDECGIKSLSDIKLYGVRMSASSVVENLDNWKTLESKIREEVSKLSDDTITKIVAAGAIDYYTDRIYTSRTLVQHLGQDCDYSKFIDLYYSKSGASSTSLIALCSNFGRFVEVDAVRKKYEQEKSALLKKYPMLKHINSLADDKDVAEYISLVNNTQQEKSNV
jgi:hypothetical protein